MTITQYNPTNLDELINISTKAALNFVEDPMSEHQDRHNPDSAPKLTADP